MNLTILTVGHLKEGYLKDAVREYEKRLSRYAKVSIVEVDDEKTPEEALDKEREAILKKEGERLLKKIREKDHVIALAIGGKSFSSEEMASEIGRFQGNSVTDLVFVIGGSLGLSRAVLDRADESWSFSKLTFPHQLMRVILLEQLYRSMKILRGEPYHK